MSQKEGNMTKRTKAGSSVWRNFIHLIQTIKLPILLIGIAFLLNLGKAAVQLLIPEKVAEVTAVDLAAGGSAVKLAVTICITLFLLALVEFVGGLAATYITYIAKASIDRDFQKVAAVVGHRAGGNRIVRASGEHCAQRGFARSVGAHYGVNLAAAYGKVDPAEDLPTFYAGVQVFDFQ